MKAAKPPPPVPPRPSKTVIAEALAKTKRAAPRPPEASARTVVFQSSDLCSKVVVKSEDEEERNEDRNRVNSLIDEMFASVLVSSEGAEVASPPADRKQVKFDDERNHELLISELESMKKEQQRISRRQRKPSRELCEERPPKIHEWVEVSDGEEVHLSSCRITIDAAKKRPSPNGDVAR